MTTARYVLLIALLVPLLGRAQEAASEGALSPPPLLPAPRGSEPSRPLTLEERYPLGVRMVLQIPMVLAGAVGGGIVGLGGAELLGSQGNERENHRISLSLLGGALGMAGTVYAGGAILGMEGSFLHTLLGAGVGLAIPTIGLVAGLSEFRTLNQVTGVVALGMLGLACPIVAYELSHAAAEKAKARPKGPWVYPIAAASPNGGSLGLAGRF